MAKEYSTPIALRFIDFDLYGHANNAVYFTYLEIARINLFKDTFRELTAAGILTVVGRAECEYKIPILLNDTVVVTSRISRLGNASFDIDYTIHNSADRVFALAKTTMVCFDTAQKRPVAVPDSIKNLA